MLITISTASTDN